MQLIMTWAGITFAYFDKDTGNYYLSFGGRNTGNKGYTYRNDGVDIYKDSTHYETYYVGSIEDSEWIQYTIDVATAATYAIKLTVAAETAGQVSITVDGKQVANKKDITSTGSLKSWQTQNVGSTSLNKGRHTIRIYFDKGGFNLKDMILRRQ
jgi:hypothetical protein